MPLCVKCNEIVGAHEIHSDGVCYSCRKPIENVNEQIESREDNNVISKSFKHLYVLSWIILVLSILASLIIFNNYGIIKIEYHGSKLNPIGIFYAVGVAVEGIFIASLGFAISNIGKFIFNQK